MINSIPFVPLVLMIAGGIAMQFKNRILISLGGPAYWIGLFFVVWSLSDIR